MVGKKHDKELLIKNKTLEKEISKRDKIEVELRKNQIKYRMLYEHAPIGYVSLDQFGNYIDVNPAWLNIIGYSYKEVIGKSFCEFLNPAWVNQFIDNFRRYKDSGELSDVEYEMTKKDGSPVIVSVNGKIGKDKHGRFLRTHCILQDITKRRQAEIALRQSEERYRNIYHNTPAMLHSIDRNDRIISVSEYWLEFFGYERRKVIGRKSVEFLSEESRRLAEDETLPLFYRYGFIRNVPYQFIKKNGEVIDVLLSATCEKDTEGEIIRSLAVLTDITTLKRTEKSLKQSENQLRALTVRLQDAEEATRKALARELHDEVGQSLTALSINLNILRSQLPPDILKLLVKRLDDSIELIEETTSTIRNIMTDLRPSILDDYGLAAALRWYGNRFSDRTGIFVKLKIDEISSRLTEFVESALFRIATEAMTNVAKHANASRLVLTLKENDGVFRLMIVDNGNGFDYKDFKKNMYHEGLGILNMHERIRALGGQLQVDSEIGNGTSVVIEIRK